MPLIRSSFFFVVGFSLQNKYWHVIFMSKNNVFIYRIHFPGGNKIMRRLKKDGKEKRQFGVPFMKKTQVRELKNEHEYLLFQIR